MPNEGVRGIFTPPFATGSTNAVGAHVPPSAVGDVSRETDTSRTLPVCTGEGTESATTGRTEEQDYINYQSVHVKQYYKCANTFRNGRDAKYGTHGITISPVNTRM